MGTIVYINLRQTNTVDFEAELADLAVKCESRSNAEFAAKSKTRSRLREINAEIRRLVAIKADAWSDQARYYELHDQVTQLRLARSQMLEPRQSSGPLCLRNRQADWS